MKNLVQVKHPGVLLLEELTKQGMKQKELAVRTGVSEKHISTIVNGTKDISVSFAHKLDIALGQSSGTWLKHQSDYDLYNAKLEEENGISSDELSILKQLKEIVDFFLEKGFMHNHCGDSEKVLQLRKLLCVNSLTAIPNITYSAAYRTQMNNNTAVDVYILFAWQRMCELLTDSYKVELPFENSKLENLLPNIKREMFTEDPNEMIGNLKRIFSKCGVAFDVVHHFKGAPTQGMIKKTSDGKVVLCLTIRGKKADSFWFSLFHEVGHLMNGDIDARFVDFDSLKGTREEAADHFARDTLIDPVKYKQLISTGRYQQLDTIKRFSDYVGVPYWITIGRLQSDGWLEWSRFANEAPKYGWA